MAQEALDVSKLLMVFPCYKTCGPTCGLHPSRSSNTMHIIFRAVGQVEVDHMADVRHVDPTGGDIRRHQYTECPAPKSFQRGTALGQAAVTVQHGYPVPGAPQQTPQPISPMLRSGKDKRRILIRS